MPSITIPVQSLDQVVARNRLYSLPAVALEVLQLTNQPQVDLRALKHCIESDPALTVKILRVVNSSLYGLCREMTDLSQAMALLGIKPLKLLVLGFSLSEAVYARVTGPMMLRYWRRAHQSGRGARNRRNGLSRSGGRTVHRGVSRRHWNARAAAGTGRAVRAPLDQPLASQRELAAAERDALGFDHTELTARLLAHWGLPKSLQASVATSHADITVDATVASATGRILHLAGLLADLLVDARHDVLSGLLDAAALHGRLTQTQLSVLVGNLQIKVAQLAEVFSLQLPSGWDYCDVLSEAQARLADVSAELAIELVNGHGASAASAGNGLETWGGAEALSRAMRRFISELTGEPTDSTNASTTTTSSARQRCVLGTTDASDVEGVRGLMHHLEAMIRAARQSRRPLSLLLVEIDQFPTLVLDRGSPEAAELAQLVGELCQHTDVPGAVCVPLRPYSFAVVLPNCDRAQAAELCRTLVHEVRHLSATGAATPVSVSAGLGSVDLPAKNFAAVTLYENTARCLSAAQLSGGNTVKSIGIY